MIRPSHYELRLPNPSRPPPPPIFWRPKRSEKLTGTFVTTLAVIRSLKPGREITYHIGELAIDRAEDRELGKLASAFRWAAENGLVRLFQRRNRPGENEYTAVRLPLNA